MAEHAAVATVIQALGKVKVSDYSLMETRQTEDIDGSPLKLVHFNISGQPFTISDELTRQSPASKLANSDLLKRHWIESLNAYYFDRDPILFNAVLNVIRYNVLNVPVGYGDQLVVEELRYWNVSCDEKRHDEDDEIENEFVWLENRFPPPPPTSHTFLQYRFLVWCFVTDPVGPYTRHRKLSTLYSFTSIILALIYLVFHGLSTSVYYRLPLDINLTQSIAGNSFTSLQVQAAALGCTDVTKIDCFLRSQPLPWISNGMSVIGVFFISETALRLLLCPSWGYFKSVINWLDITASLCAVVLLVLKGDAVMLIASGSYPSRTHQYGLILMQAMQVLRVFKIFQVSQAKMYKLSKMMRLYFSISVIK